MPVQKPTPFVSIIVPCRNEAQHIGRCLQSIMEGDYPAEQLEVLVVDGRSDDGTREIVEEYTARYPMLRLLDNPKRITPVALNIGVHAARGDVVMRMDAHVVYPRDYVASLVAALEESGADCVGGVIETLPLDQTPIARAIALGLSHPFGVGNAYFRIGSRQRRWADAVSFGCYRREVFDRIGLFDEDLVRNQDDEFDLRLFKHGGRILLVPEVVCSYYARRSLRQLGRMFYQYGYFKPLVAKKLGKVMTLRQLVPALFLLTAAVTGLAGLAWPPARLAFAGVVAAYATAVLACAGLAVPRQGWRCGAALAVVFAVLHGSYGAGFLRGVGDHLLGWRRQPAAGFSLTR
ncbi:MAG TPA: glycosyltransferase family 2 protein [Gemmatimonadales bacterium]|nr:glycosyltransferase family 2 protein [Gemmatimonadales bacterium]